MNIQSQERKTMMPSIEDLVTPTVETDPSGDGQANPIPTRINLSCRAISQTHSA